MKQNWILLATATLTSFTALGCAGPRMVPPGDVAEDSRTLDVQGRKNASGALVKEDFQLGEWKVQNVNRKWGKSSSVGIGGYSSEKTKTGYSYELAASQVWKGACSAIKSEKGVGNFSWGKSALVCECTAGDETVISRLAGTDAKKHTEGEVELGAVTWKASVVDATDKSNLTGAPPGYRFDENGAPRAAVETLHPGKVWLKTELTDAQAEGVSCISAGLMLYVPPSDF